MTVGTTLAELCVSELDNVYKFGKIKEQLLTSSCSIFPVPRYSDANTIRLVAARANL